MQTITKNAFVDDLTDEDYKDILDELLGSMSSRQLVALIDSEYSFAYYNAMQRGERPITRQAKNELRRAYNKPPLPPTIAEAVAVMNENGEVRRIGTETPDLIYMLNHAETGDMQAVTGVTTRLWANQRKNDRVYNMTEKVLAWKIANREEYSVA